MCLAGTPYPAHTKPRTQSLVGQRGVLLAVWLCAARTPVATTKSLMLLCLDICHDYMNYRWLAHRMKAIIRLKLFSILQYVWIPVRNVGFFSLFLLEIMLSYQIPAESIWNLNLWTVFVLQLLDSFILFSGMLNKKEKHAKIAWGLDIVTGSWYH